jgi:hypothetical protein
MSSAKQEKKANDAQEKVIFKDEHNLNFDPNISLAFFERIRPMLRGRIMLLDAERASPHINYNVRLFTDQNEEIWFSGFSCGKNNKGAFGLCELIEMLGWSSWLQGDAIPRTVLGNSKFVMQYEGPGDKVIWHTEEAR